MTTNRSIYKKLSLTVGVFLAAVLLFGDFAMAQSVRGGNRGGASRGRGSSASAGRGSSSRSKPSTGSARSTPGKTTPGRGSSSGRGASPGRGATPNSKKGPSSSPKKKNNASKKKATKKKKKKRYRRRRRRVRRRRIIIGAYLITRPRTVHVVYVGTYPYYYSGGVYYVVKSEVAYVAVPAPAGAVLEELPEGAITIHYEGQDYYEFEGSWYVQISGGYQVIAPPVGIVIEDLPEDTIVRQIDKQTYFSWGGVYYLAVFVNGKTAYEVVTKPTQGPPPEGVLYDLPLGSIEVEIEEDIYDHYIDGLWYTETDRGYELVQATPGVSVPYLPEGATIKNSNRKSYMVFDDTWYEPYTTEEGTLYRVVEPPA